MRWVGEVKIQKNESTNVGAHSLSHFLKKTTKIGVASRQKCAVGEADISVIACCTNLQAL